MTKYPTIREKFEIAFSLEGMVIEESDRTRSFEGDSYSKKLWSFIEESLDEVAELNFNLGLSEACHAQLDAYGRLIVKLHHPIEEVNK